MRILLDESMPRRFAASLSGHDVRTVGQCGWAGTKNGRLLALAATQFDVPVTADRNIQYQQNLKALPIAIVVLATQDGRISSFQQLVPRLLATLKSLVPFSLVELGL